MPLPSKMPGFGRTIGLQSGANLQALTDLIGSVQPNVTAKAGGTKAAAVQLNAAVCEVSVCATNDDSVILPLGFAGLEVIIANGGAATLRVFGKGTDIINGVATATGVTQATGITALYKCAEVTAAGVGQWYRVLSA